MFPVVAGKVIRINTRVSYRVLLQCRIIVASVWLSFVERISGKKVMTKARALGEFEQYVMLATVRLGENAYGNTIRQLLFEVVHREVSIGALYTTLGRLEEKGLLSSTLGEATEERGRRAKKYFKVTAEGSQMLQQSRRSLEALWRDLSLSFIPGESS